MRVPAIRGVIARRILANYRIDAEVMSRALPAPFKPMLVGGYAIGGICLIRLSGIRPKGLKLPLTFASENAAHRIAVQWQNDGETRQGVYVPRRDSNSWLNTMVGGRFFPGIQHRASFSNVEEAPFFSVTMDSNDGNAHVHVAGTVAEALPNKSVFDSLDHASDFFRLGSLGYSPASGNRRYDGIELQCDHWKVEPMDIESVRSSYFDDKQMFPSGSTTFDNALLMRDIPHEWHSSPQM